MSANKVFPFLCGLDGISCHAEIYTYTKFQDCNVLGCVKATYRNTHWKSQLNHIVMRTNNQKVTSRVITFARDDYYY